MTPGEGARRTFLQTVPGLLMSFARVSGAAGVHLRPGPKGLDRAAVVEAHLNMSSVEGAVADLAHLDSGALGHVSHSCGGCPFERWAPARAADALSYAENTGVNVIEPSELDHEYHSCGGRPLEWWTPACAAGARSSCREPPKVYEIERFSLPCLVRPALQQIKLFKHCTD